MRLPLSLLLLAAGCATTAPTQVPPPEHSVTQVELTVEGMAPELLEQMKAEIARIPELSTAQVEAKAGNLAVWTMRFEGDVDDLPKVLSQLPHPGLRFASAKHLLQYTAFDNLPPTIAFIHPKDQQVVNAKQQFVTVEVPDADIQEVSVAGKPAQRFKGNVYRIKLELNEGLQQLTAIAKDKAGNETSVVAAVTVDTTPPAVNAQVKLVVEGIAEPESTVLIDGLEAAVGRDGSYRAEVPVKPGQKRVEIIAIDKTGNKTTSYKQLGN